MAKCEDKKMKKVAFADDQIKVAEQFGNTPESVYGPAPEVPVDETVTTDVTEPEKPDLKKQLKEIADAKETKEAAKKTAEELIARLDELEQAEKNAEKFISENKVIVPAETPAPAEASVTTEVPPVA